MFCAAMLALMLPTAFAQTRSDLITRFGQPWTETFLIPPNVKLNVAYGPGEHVCSLRIETVDHSQRAAPNLTDTRYWIDTGQVNRLLVELVPPTQRKGKVEHSKVGLRVGEYALIESDDSVEITRIQRNAPLLLTSKAPVADRLVTVQWKRPECQNVLAAK